MAKECYNTISSNCVSNESSSKANLKTQTEFNESVFNSVEQLKSDTDMSSLRSNTNEILQTSSTVEVIQYILNQLAKVNTNNSEISADDIQIIVNLKTLTNDCNTGAMTLNPFAQLLVDEIVSLRQKIIVLESKLNN